MSSGHKASIDVGTDVDAIDHEFNGIARHLIGWVPRSSERGRRRDQLVVIGTILAAVHVAFADDDIAVI